MPGVKVMFGMLTWPHVSPRVEGVHILGISLGICLTMHPPLIMATAFHRVTRIFCKYIFEDDQMVSSRIRWSYDFKDK